ncbi:MAG: tautomerase family protein [Dehalococcoidales bacterium]|nr:tautomerase family protein [Dehalococcoidales bacterium]
MGLRRGLRMPLVTVKVKGVRTIEQKRALVKDITEAVVKHFKVQPEVVTIDIVEYSEENMAKAGKLFIDR